MENPFDKVYEIDAHHAAVLAQAFLSANNPDEFWAILRYACCVDQKAGGFYQAYLGGRIFDAWCAEQEFDSEEAFEDLRRLASEYKTSCQEIPGLWRLS